MTKIDIFSGFLGAGKTTLTKLLTGLLQCHFQDSPDLFFIYSLFFHSKNFRASAKCAHTDIISQAKSLCHLTVVLQILCCNCFVVF